MDLMVQEVYTGKWTAGTDTATPRTFVQTYVLKMARSGEDGEKVFLLLESGSRFHTTEVGQGAYLSPGVQRCLCVCV